MGTNSSRFAPATRAALKPWLESARHELRRQFDFWQSEDEAANRAKVAVKKFLSAGEDGRKALGEPAREKWHRQVDEANGGPAGDIGDLANTLDALYEVLLRCDCLAAEAAAIGKALNVWKRPEAVPKRNTRTALQAAWNVVEALLDECAASDSGRPADETGLGRPNQPLGFDVDLNGLRLHERVLALHTALENGGGMRYAEAVEKYGQAAVDSLQELTWGWCDGDLLMARPILAGGPGKLVELLRASDAPAPVGAAHETSSAVEDKLREILPDGEIVFPTDGGGRQSVSAWEPWQRKLVEQTLVGKYGPDEALRTLEIADTITKMSAVTGVLLQREQSGGQAAPARAAPEMPADLEAVRRTATECVHYVWKLRRWADAEPPEWVNSPLGFGPEFFVDCLLESYNQASDAINGIREELACVSSETPTYGGVHATSYHAAAVDLAERILHASAESLGTLFFGGLNPETGRTEAKIVGWREGAEVFQEDPATGRAITTGERAWPKLRDTDFRQRLQAMPAFDGDELAVRIAKEAALAAERRRTKLAALHNAPNTAAPPTAPLADQSAVAGPDDESASGGRGSVKPINRPSEKALQAWRLRDLTGIKNQAEIAAKMTQEGTPANQGQVSRWLKQVEAYLAAGNVLPGLPVLPVKKPRSIDPKLIDMGKNQEGRTPRQQHRRNSNSDDE